MNWNRHPFEVKDGDTLKRHNFAQREPGTHIPELDGKKLTFVDCNLQNVAIDPLWTVKGCLTVQKAWPTDAEREHCHKVTKLEGVKAMQEHLAEQCAELEADLGVVPKEI